MQPSVHVVHFFYFILWLYDTYSCNISGLLSLSSIQCYLYLFMEIGGQLHSYRERPQISDITWLSNSPSSWSISFIGTYWLYVGWSLLQLIMQLFIHAVFCSLRRVITRLILLYLCWHLDVSCNLMSKNIS